MADRFDQAYTLNFTTIACVRGPLSAARIEQALRCLELRHPLLRARVHRDPSASAFVAGEAREIPLLCVQAPQEELLALATETLAHCHWEDAGPRAELTWVRHDAEHSSLMLRQHHVVSDGTSGILAMRDLLTFLADPDLERVEPLPSPGQDAFFPSDHAAMRAAFLESVKAGKMPAVKEALRVSTFSDAAWTERKPVVRRIRLSAPATATLAAQARHDGATVHGVLMASISLALARETGKSALQRLLHPVDLRRYLRELDPSAESIGDRMGYYVSSVMSEHEVQGDERVGDLARAITAAVRAGKQAREPLMAAPIRGPLLVERTRALDTDAFRELTEHKLFANTYGISNLGPLERVGVVSRVGDLQVEDIFFVAASSVMNQLGGTAVSFAGQLSLQLSCVEPLVSRVFLDALTERTREILQGYLQGAEAAHRD